MNVIILRGLPGCGKSTFTKTLDKPFICSADDFFMVNGVYVFDPSRIGDAHANCFYRYIMALHERYQNPIVVDNTNCTAVEIAPYALAASAFGVADLKVITIDTPMDVCLKRNVHGVPSKVLVSMADEMKQPLPPWWTQRVIQGS